jgi:hypothetical protein
VSTAIASQEFSVLAESEEIPMTMQVGMVGTDGILIASDKVWTLSGIRGSHTATKFRYSVERGVGVACSESDISLNVAAKIVAELDAGHFEHPCREVERMAGDVMCGFDRSHLKIRGILPPQSQCLIAIAKPFGLFSLKVGPEGQKCQYIEDKTRVGDTQNSAVFFMEEYYALRPIKHLRLLAAHIVFEASRRNPTGIGGLEILECDSSGLRMLPPDEINRLKKRSDALHGKVETALS